MRSPHVQVRIDLDVIRHNLASIRHRIRAGILAVVKADAYGLGAADVVAAMADRVDGFCVFSLAEAVAAGIWDRTGKPTIALGPPDTLDPAPWLAAHVRPAVATAEQAQALRSADPLVCVDVGMQRFACPVDQLDAVIEAGDCREAFAHAPTMEHVRRLVEVAGQRGLKLHAAASSLLDEPAARLDAVRPGLACYRGAVTVTTPLLDARDSSGPVGYTGFTTRRHGVIGCGYAHGLRKGPCLVKGRMSRILEVGMQSAYVELGPGEKEGDLITLLGPELPEETVAAAWGGTAHEVLTHLARCGRRQHVK